MCALYALFDVCRFDVFVCFDMCGVFVVGECRLFLSFACMLCKWVEWVSGVCVVVVCLFHHANVGR